MPFLLLRASRAVQGLSRVWFPAELIADLMATRVQLQRNHCCISVVHPWCSLMWGFSGEVREHTTAAHQITPFFSICFSNSFLLRLDKFSIHLSSLYWFQSRTFLAGGGGNSGDSIGISPTLQWHRCLWINQITHLILLRCSYSISLSKVHISHLKRRQELQNIIPLEMTPVNPIFISWPTFMCYWSSQTAWRHQLLKMYRYRGKVLLKWIRILDSIISPSINTYSWYVKEHSGFVKTYLKMTASWTNLWQPELLQTWTSQMNNVYHSSTWFILSLTGQLCRTSLSWYLLLEEKFYCPLRCILVLVHLIGLILAVSISEVSGCFDVLLGPCVGFPLVTFPSCLYLLHSWQETINVFCRTLLKCFFEECFLLDSTASTCSFFAGTIFSIHQ